jgi:hypothetical protein
MLSWNTSQQEEQTNDVFWRDFWMDEGGRDRPGDLTLWQHYDDDSLYKPNFILDYILIQFHDIFSKLVHAKKFLNSLLCNGLRPSNYVILC